MSKINPIINGLIIFGFGFSIPQVITGHLIWLLVLVPGFIYFVLRISSQIKK